MFLLNFQLRTYTFISPVALCKTDTYNSQLKMFQLECRMYKINYLIANYKFVNIHYLINRHLDLYKSKTLNTEKRHVL